MKWRDPDEARRRLYEIAQQQAGYFSAKQAVEAGYSRRLHTYHCDRGHWLRIERGIYRLRDFPSSEHEDLVRWTLWSRGAAVVSHETAALVHELGDLLPARVHLTVPPGFRKKVPGGVIVHRCWLKDDEVFAQQGFRVTTPLRTIVDLIRYGLESDRLAGVIRHALDQGSVRRKALEAKTGDLDEEFRERARRILKLAEERRSAI